MAGIPPRKNIAFTFYYVMVSRLGGGQVFQVNPTIAAGDFQTSGDGGAFANLTTLPDALPAGSARVRIQLSAAEMQQKMQFDQAKLQFDQARLELDQAKLALDAQKEQARLAAEAAQAQADNQIDANNMAIRQAMNTQDNLTAMELAKLEVVSGEKFGVSTGTGINP